jgi:hypothetical protein
MCRTRTAAMTHASTSDPQAITRQVCRLACRSVLRRLTARQKAAKCRPSLCFQRPARRANRAIPRWSDLRGVRPPVPPWDGGIGVRPKTIFASHFNDITPVQPLVEKYFTFAFSETSVRCSCPALDQEGRFAIVTNVGCGMRWACRCCSVIFRADEQHDAYGEIVWSWHPDADAKFATTLWRRAGDGGQKARCTGESTYKP